MTVRSYQVSTSGAVAINAVKNNVYGSSAVKERHGDLVAAAAHPCSGERIQPGHHARHWRRSADHLGPDGHQPGHAVPTSNSLADQLKMVARLIGARVRWAPSARCFGVAGGFDLHDNLISQHPGLLTKVSEAMTAFLQRHGRNGVANQVTTLLRHRTSGARSHPMAMVPTTDGAATIWWWAVRWGAAFYGTPPPVS